MVMKGLSEDVAAPPPYYRYGEPRRSSRRLRFARRLRSLAVATALLFGVISILNYRAAFETTSKRLPSDDERFQQGLEHCHAATSTSRSREEPTAADRSSNPRWEPKAGQSQRIVLRNATLFDGESIFPHAVDIAFEKGLIRSISATDEVLSDVPFLEDAEVVTLDLHGQFVTPGLVDMHSHHLESSFPSLRATGDINEAPGLGPITPFVRAVDGFKPYDPAIRIIASGGVTSSLNLPGSANIIGGEAYLVKNLPTPGPDAEPVVKELLFDHGLPPTAHRQRYLKLACGENPKGKYGHTRLGLAWLLREHLNAAKELLDRQEAWCRGAAEIAAQSSGRSWKGSAGEQRVAHFLAAAGTRPEDFELQTTVALLRGELNVNVHCYEPEDFESILSVLHEFGVHPNAFHHALEAWQLPEFLKKAERNITIATFADNALFKHEAYGASLRAAKILNDHGLAVAFKSDHAGESNFAKYLVYQASIAHSYGLPEIKALQSVTSIPAHSIQQDHRVGYARPGYDADLVVWDAHPLSVGATPSQVFIDGRPVLDSDIGSKVLPFSNKATNATLSAPKPRPVINEAQTAVCEKLEKKAGTVLFTGISRVLLDHPLAKEVEGNDKGSQLVVLVDNNRIACFNTHAICTSSLPSGEDDETVVVNLENGYITPGLLAVGNNLGIQDIPSEPSTGDGSTSGDALHFAKYGLHFGGRGLGRARIGGVTRAVTAPAASGLLRGVSVGLRTSENATILHGGIWKDEVALHVAIGQDGKGTDTPSISSGIERLRQLLEDGKTSQDNARSVYARAVNGSLPIVVHAVNQDDISQVILLKRDFPSAHFVIYGGHTAPLVAQDLAEAKIPVILAPSRGAPAQWDTRFAPVGPPLTESPVRTLTQAGVLVGLAVKGDSKVHGLAQEAQWAAKYAGLAETEAVKLVSTNLEEILLLRGSRGEEEAVLSDYGGDFVVWEGNPLQGEGSVVLTVQDDGGVGDCWPDRGNW